MTVHPASVPWFGEKPTNCFFTAKSMSHNGVGVVALYDNDRLSALVTHNNNTFHYNVLLAVKAKGLVPLRVTHFGGHGDDFGRKYTEFTEESIVLFLKCLLNDKTQYTVAYY